MRFLLLLIIILPISDNSFAKCSNNIGIKVFSSIHGGDNPTNVECKLNDLGIKYDIYTKTARKTDLMQTDDFFDVPNDDVYGKLKGVTIAVPEDVIIQFKTKLNGFKYEVGIYFNFSYGLDETFGLAYAKDSLFTVIPGPSNTKSYPVISYVSAVVLDRKGKYPTSQTEMLIFKKRKEKLINNIASSLVKNGMPQSNMSIGFVNNSMSCCRDETKTLQTFSTKRYSGLKVEIDEYANIHISYRPKEDLDETIKSNLGFVRRAMEDINIDYGSDIEY